MRDSTTIMMTDARGAPDVPRRYEVGEVGEVEGHDGAVVAALAPACDASNAVEAPECWIGEYRLDGELPAGAIELAYGTTHRVLPRRARVAILRPELAGDARAEAQLTREACALEALRHPGVPRVFECGVVAGRLWVAGEFVEGASIARATTDRPLAIGDALAVLRDAAAVLAHAHARRMAHGGLTPHAIVRTPDRPFPICITEWGRAAVDQPGATGTACPACPTCGQRVEPTAEAGDRFYRAPEVIAGARGSECGDVFALGAVMFEALTLVLPEPVQRLPGVPAALHDLLAGMLQRDPAERPTARIVHAEAARLAETFNDGDGAIVEVEVELVDISQNPPAMPALEWRPPAVRARGTVDR
jgi:serine/threonine-protein kinase